MQLLVRDDDCWPMKRESCRLESTAFCSSLVYERDVTALKDKYPTQYKKTKKCHQLIREGQEHKRHSYQQHV
ncbi:hypothetical protein C1H46_029028 [Malus baccata]|uniref:Uncharacterized protein n=1 Tax=Malus baccata TaxID=106549 RepID=A0A540LFZ6_MALBA|nr:hypothetical protein C1H46_029028 [Malus baccata]